MTAVRIEHHFSLTSLPDIKGTQHLVESALFAGQTIGHYRIVGLLGRGGMGEVFEAEDNRLKRRVALKVLPTELGRDGERLRRFRREAEAVAALNHPNVVTIFSVEHAQLPRQSDEPTDDAQTVVPGETVHFLTMELVEGRTLDALLPTAGLQLDSLLDIAVPLAAAVAAAHEKGITHRDLKPANVMVTDRNQVKVLDFGLAKFPQHDPDLQAETASMDVQTADGVVLGTVAYMSPEQAEGRTLDHRTDIFSLGVMLYEMATGAQPFTGNSAAAVISGILRDPVPSVDTVRPHLPRQLSRIIDHCLEKNLEARFQTAQDVYNLLARLQQEVVLEKASAGRPASAQVDSPSPGLRSSRGRVAAGLAVVGTIAGLWWWSPSPAPPQGLRRIAVLPSINLGPPERQYFAAAMTEEIVSRLVAVDGVAVPSRVRPDPTDRSNKTLGQLGLELDVDYILEATVQWQETDDGSTTVRITPQLIDVANDRNLWSELYEHDMVGGNLFAVQSEIAERVLDQVGITLQASQVATADARGTDRADAYDAYMRGSESLLLADELYREEDLYAAVRFLEDAVTIDDTFALAHAKLGLAHAFAYHLYFDRSEDRREQARDSAERALALAPNLPEGRLALGHYFRAGLEYELALNEYQLAARGRPGDSVVVQAIAELNWHMGNTDESISAYERASLIDPQRSVLFCNRGGAHRMKGDFEEADVLHDHAVSLQPDRACPYFCLVFVQLHSGDLAGARAVVDLVPPTVGMDEIPPINYPLFLIDLIEARYEDGLERLASGPADAYDFQQFYYPKALLRGQIHRFMGNSEAARQDFDEAVQFLEEKVEARRGDSRYHSSLGLAYAGLGRTQEAIAEGLLGVELLPFAKDKFAGPYRLRDLAQIYVMVGEHDAALENLQILTTIESQIHLPEVAGDPTWEPLHDDPRFQALIAG